MTVIWDAALDESLARRRPWGQGVRMDPSSEATSVPDEGVVFAQALARKDVDALRAVLAPDVDFRGLTPRRFWECGTPEEVVEVVFGNWFEPQEEILALLDVATGEPVEDTRRVGYRLA